MLFPKPETPENFRVLGHGIFNTASSLNDMTRLLLGYNNWDINRGHREKGEI